MFFFQVYLPVKSVPKLTELLFLCVIGHLSKGYYTPDIDYFLAKKVQDHVDSYPYLLGLLCLLRQYPDPISQGLVEYLAQYTRSFVAEHTTK